MTSGARYHLSHTKSFNLEKRYGKNELYLVATYSVIKVLVSSTFGGGNAERARPKSQSYTEDDELDVRQPIGVD